MSQLVTCPNGHQWELSGDERTLARGAPLPCPMCGAAGALAAAGPGTAIVPPSPAPGAVGSGETATVPPQPVYADATAAPTLAEHLRDRIAGYEILSELGRGGMGVVYKARQVNLGRLVALKMILAGGHASADDLARFRSEAEAIARLQHPNIVQVYEVSEQNGLPYFSLEFCAGGSLAQQLKGIPLPPQSAAQKVEVLARAMHAAHKAGIIHRDLKPANVLLTADGQLKISDFGLVKRLDDPTGRTGTGVVMGTPSYMAPEQAGTKKTIGPAADVYALGAILYELLTGRPPFKAEAPLDTVLQVIADEPVPPRQRQPKVPRDVETICLKCLRKDAAKRYASAEALADDLARWLRGEPIVARPMRAPERVGRWLRRYRAAVALALAALIAGVVVSLILGRLGNEPRAPVSTGAGTIPGEAPGKPAVPPLPDDLTWVAPDSMAFVSVEASALWARVAGTEQQPPAAKELTEALSRLEQGLGYRLSETERVVIGVGQDTMSVATTGFFSHVVIVTMNRAYSPTRLLESILPGSQEKQYDGKTYRVNYELSYFRMLQASGSGFKTFPTSASALQGTAIYFVNDRTFLYGPEESVLKLLKRGARPDVQGPLSSALRQVSGRHQVVVGLNVPRAFLTVWFATILQAGLQPGVLKDVQDLSALAEFNTAVLLIDLDEGLQIRLDLRLQYADEPAAGEARAAADRGLTLLKKNLPAALAGIDKKPNDRETLFLKNLQDVLPTLAVVQQGAEVQISLTAKSDRKTLIESFSQYAKYYQSDDREKSGDNLGMLVLAMIRYQIEHDGRFPPPVVYASDGTPLLSWRVAILPYLEERDLYNQFHLAEPWDSPHNRTLLERMPKVFAPGEPRAKERGKTYYQVFVGPGTLFEGKEGVRLAEVDGPENRVVLVEAGESVPWTKPEDLPYDPTKPLPKLGGAFPGGFHAVTAGPYPTTRFLKKDTPGETLRALITRKGEKIEFLELPTAPEANEKTPP